MPHVWICPNPSTANQLFQRSERWDGRGIAGVKLYIGWLRKGSDEDLRAMAALLRTRRLEVMVELGGLLNHDWQDEIGERSAEVELTPLRRWRDAGGPLHVLDVDGPIRRAMGHGWGKDPAKRFSDPRRIAGELAEHVEAVRAEFPRIRVQLLSYFPNWGWKDGPDYHRRGSSGQNWGDYRGVFTTVMDTLTDRGVRVDAVTVDNPYGYATGAKQSRNLRNPSAIDWIGRIAELFELARGYGLTCNLIVNSERGGKTSDAAFHAETVAYAGLVVKRGLHPDAVIVQSWYKYPLEVAGTETSLFATTKAVRACFAASPLR